MRPQRPKGFSLIELMVTLAIFAILAMLSMPGFSTLIANSRVRSVAESLQNDLRKAQAEAVRRNHQTVFALTAAAPSISAAASTTGKNWFIRLVNVVLAENAASATAGGNFYIAGATTATSYDVSIVGGAAMICFNSSGRLVANANTTSDGYVLNCTLPVNAANTLEYDLTKAGADRPLRVTVFLGGQVRMCDPAQSLAAGQPAGCT